MDTRTHPARMVAGPKRQARCRKKKRMHMNKPKMTSGAGQRRQDTERDAKVGQVDKNVCRME